MRSNVCLRWAWVGIVLLAAGVSRGDQLRAGAARADITDRAAGPVNDPLYAKALVLKNGKATAVVISLDAVSVGEIGYIGNDYLPKLRARLEKELGIKPGEILVNASHCHGIVDKTTVLDKTFQAVKEALGKLEPVRVGAGVGREDRVMENRRIKLMDGTTADVRHAYALPADAKMAEVGPVDPEIGLLRLDRLDGRPLAVVFQFACHPIQGVPSGANTADMSGFAAQVIEDNLGDGALALFLQGCGGDINPLNYRDVDNPRDAEPLGNRLGLSALKGIRAIKTRDDSRLAIVNTTLTLPRSDFRAKIAETEAECVRQMKTLKGTSLNLKAFLALSSRYAQGGDFPSYDAHRYLHDRRAGRPDYDTMDKNNRANMEAYIKNIETMEELTRLQTNLALLKKHQAQHDAAGSKTLDTELCGLRVGDFVLVTFPGELTVRLGLNLKKVSPHKATFVSGYTNGYIYYAPTDDQLGNCGHAQEDSDTLLAPGWQGMFESASLKLLKGL